MVEQKRKQASRSTLQHKTPLPMDPSRTRGASLREINFEKQRLRRLEEQQYSGLAANMVRSPLRMHEEQKLKNDSPARSDTSFSLKGLNKPPPRDLH